MKKALKLAILFCLALLTCALILTACDSRNANETAETLPTKQTTLTKENFKNYFIIEVEPDIDITKHGDTSVLGYYIPATYSAVADVDVNVFSCSPFDSYNVAVTLKVFTGSVYWNEKTVTLYLSSSGSASKNLEITTVADEKILFESDCNPQFYVSIISVEGTIKEK